MTGGRRRAYGQPTVEGGAMVMRTWTGLLVAAAGSMTGTMAGTAAIAASAASTGGTDTTEPPPAILFEDSFDDDRNGWGVVDDPDYGTAEFVDGDYVWALRGSVAHWLAGVLGDQYDRDELEMRDVVVQADLTIVAGGGVAGVFCRETPDSDAEWQWYEFVVRDGYAAIRLADLEGNLEPLAETDDVDLPAGEPITIEASCVDDADGAANLGMTVNGDEILTATAEDPLGNGVPGLQAWTFPMHEQLDLVWHSFAVLAPPAAG
jgi:hypothetical protein